MVADQALKFVPTSNFDLLRKARIMVSCIRSSASSFLFVNFNANEKRYLWYCVNKSEKDVLDNTAAEEDVLFNWEEIMKRSLGGGC